MIKSDKSDNYRAEDYDREEKRREEKRSIALCVPTYERSDIVEDFLINCSAYYIQAGIDIYYYDSSVSDKTKDLVCGWPDQDHVHYVRMPSELLPTAKAFKIYQGYGLKKKYDFIWLSGDAYQCSKSAIEQIVSNLSLEYDIIEVGGDTVEDYHKVGTKKFTDPNEYMQKCIWHFTLFGAVILNANTMLSGVDWAYYEEKFLAKSLIDFAHVSFCFYRILELDKFCALHLVIPRMSRFSRLKIVRSWTKIYYEVMCAAWLRTLEDLPSCYTGKEQVQADIREINITNIDQFYRHKELGIYSLRVFLKYWAVWDKVVPFPKWKLFSIAMIPGPLVKMFYSLRRTMGRIKLQKFCAGHKRIFIYGTGLNGELYARYFDQWKLTYEAFCVSRRKRPCQENRGHPVYEFAELKCEAGDIGFVIAMEQANVDEVLSVVQKTVRKRDIFCDVKFSEDILADATLHAKNRSW